jgi:hypothetical protein
MTQMPKMFYELQLVEVFVGLFSPTSGTGATV